MNFLYVAVKLSGKVEIFLVIDVEPGKEFGVPKEIKNVLGVSEKQNL